MAKNTGTERRRGSQGGLVETRLSTGLGVKRDSATGRFATMKTANYSGTGRDPVKTPPSMGKKMTLKNTERSRQLSIVTEVIEEDKAILAALAK